MVTCKGNIYFLTVCCLICAGQPVAMVKVLQNNQGVCRDLNGGLKEKHVQQWRRSLICPGQIKSQMGMGMVKKVVGVVQE